MATLVCGLLLITPQLALGQPAAPEEDADSDAEAAEEADEADGEAAEKVASDAEEDSAWEGLEDEEERLPLPVIKADLSKNPPGYTREPHHVHRWVFHNLTAARVNPLGLTNRFRTGYQMQLSHRPETIFMKSHAAVLLDTEITPAYGVVGGRFELQPAALLNVYASYGMMGTFSTFSNTRSFPTAEAEYSDDALGDSRDEDYATLGHRATLSALFQFGLGGVALRNNIKGHFFSMDLEGDDRVFYDTTLDVLIPNSGWVLTNDADLLVITELDLIIGMRWTYTHALYSSSHLAGEDNPNSPHHRLGPALIYNFFDEDPGPTWTKVSALLLSQWWFDHRYRTTESPSLPYLVLGLVQQGDFLISDKE